MGSVDHILYQVKNVDVPNTAYDTGFSPFTEEKDFTICLEWQILSGINSSGNITFTILGSDGNTLRTLQAAYYNHYFYFDVFGNRRATQNRHMVDYKINRAVATYSNGTLKSYFIGVGSWTKNNVAFVITDVTIKIGSAGRTNSCKLREFTFYDYAMTEEEALEYINAPMQFSSEYLVARRRQIMLTTPHLETVSGTVVSFSTDLRSNFKECRVHFTPVQEGTGDPSPENVRPISGWDGVTVNLTGKNLFDASGEYLNNKWINNNGEIVDSLNNRPTLIYTQKISVVSGTDYTIHGACNNIQYIRVVYYDENDNFLGRVVSNGKPNPSKKFTPITGTAYVLVNPDTAIQNIQLEKGSSPTTYEPFGQSLTIPFPQTIYGGYVDLMKGEVVETDVKYTSTGTEKWTNDGANYYLNYNLGGNCKTGTRFNPVCSHLDDGNAWISVNGKLNIKRSSISSVASDLDGYKSWLVSNNENGTPLSVVYPLATPITYPIDQVTIRTLKGINNIWSDANGNIELKFWTH